MHEPSATRRPSEYPGQQPYAGEATWSRAVEHGGPQAGAAEAAVEFFTQYARERPEVVAMWAFGVGFMLGWKLRPW